MADTKLRQAQDEVMAALQVVSEAPIGSYEEFEEAVYYGEISVVDSLAKLIHIVQPPKTDKTVDLPHYTQSLLQARVHDKKFLAQSEQWGADKKTEPHRR